MAEERSGEDATAAAVVVAWPLLSGTAGDNSVLEPTSNVTVDDVDDGVFVTSLCNHNNNVT